MSQPISNASERSEKLHELQRLIFLTNWVAETQNRFLKKRGDTEWSTAKISTIDDALDMMRSTVKMFKLQDEEDLKVYAHDGPEED